MKNVHVVALFAAAAVAAVSSFSSTALAEKPSFSAPRVVRERMPVDRAPRFVHVRETRQRVDMPRESRPRVDAHRPEATRVDKEVTRIPPQVRAAPVTLVRERVACQPGSPGCGERAHSAPDGHPAGEASQVGAFMRRVSAILNAWKARAREE